MRTVRQAEARTATASREGSEPTRSSSSGSLARYNQVARICNMPFFTSSSGNHCDTARAGNVSKLKHSSDLCVCLCEYVHVCMWECVCVCVASSGYPVSRRKVTKLMTQSKVSFQKQDWRKLENTMTAIQKTKKQKKKKKPREKTLWLNSLLKKVF